jgi:Protein of unknown function (DUF2752)
MRTWFKRLDRAEIASFLLVCLLLLAGTGVPIAVSLAVTPDDIESGRVSLSPPCPYLKRTGQPCPSCGLTRGLAAFSHGDFARAARYDEKSIPLGIALYLTALGALALGAMCGARLRRASSLESLAEQAAG